MILEIQQTSQRPAVTEHQELRKFTGEALREPVRWFEHPAWSVVADREARGETFRVHISPPPAMTDAEIHALIVGKQ
jgi:hypothetical protein